MDKKTPKELGLDLLNCIKSDLYDIQHNKSENYVYTHIQSYYEAGADLNVIDEDGWSCFIYAIYNNNLDNLKELIKYGADINILSKYGWTALIYASNIHRIDCMNILIEAGANMTITDIHGMNFIHKCDSSMMYFFITYEFQKTVLSKEPSLINTFKEMKIPIDSNIQLEYPHLVIANDVGLI